MLADSYGTKVSVSKLKYSNINADIVVEENSAVFSFFATSAMSVSIEKKTSTTKITSSFKYL